MTTIPQKAVIFSNDLYLLHQDRTVSPNPANRWYDEIMKRPDPVVKWSFQKGTLIVHSKKGESYAQTQECSRKFRETGFQKILCDLILREEPHEKS